ncbi:U-box domain-containing protein [Candidatus Finniella inopinata]|uniref:U-box domain-containing protein n=1 Tax=Candidatus Finniella inopinata TaxID=1696036 RepID=A0A4Q7DHA7_9PROT|nr:U-box domain-containing protein [Candidatus Finniella inopinata]RZI45519.1 U-box domain-containing protein [Candidatus Finniella inopinata]
MKKITRYCLLTCAFVLMSHTCMAAASSSAAAEMPASAVSDDAGRPRRPACLCPITSKVMRDPVVASDGHTYERAAIVKLIGSSRDPKSPLTGLPFTSKDVFDNLALKRIIEEFNPRIQGEPSALEPLRTSPSAAAVENGKGEKDEEKAKISVVTHRPIPAIAHGYEEVYQRLLKGQLVYRPNKGSDIGMIVLPFASLENPLDGTFNLSQCGDAGQYLSIATGYRQGKKAENANKVEIWIAPRFVIDMAPATTAGHFKSIIREWPVRAPIGLFWTWGGADSLNIMDYSVFNSFEQLASETLNEKHKVANSTHETTGESLLHSLVYSWRCPKEEIFGHFQVSF